MLCNRTAKLDCIIDYHIPFFVIGVSMSWIRKFSPFCFVESFLIPVTGIFKPEKDWNASVRKTRQKQFPFGYLALIESELNEESTAANRRGKKVWIHNHPFQTQQRVNSQCDCNLFKSNAATEHFIAALVSGAQSWTVLNAVWISSQWLWS